MRCGYVDSSLGQVHYRMAGAGEPLLLLHQPPRSSRVYGRLMAELESLGGLRAIAIDLPGFGESCDLPRGTSMAQLADVVHEVMGVLCDHSAHVFGLHTGNKIAAALASRYPRSVRRLALAGMTHSIILDGERRNVAMSEYVRHKKPTDPDTDPPAWRDEQIDQLQCRGREAIYEANYAFDLTDALGRVPVESLVIELAVPQEEVFGRQAAAICALMPRGRALQIDSDDRTLLQQNPGQLARALRDFTLGRRDCFCVW
jgi:pimeloyl-ACP methyl ester carboxylesterase